MNIEEVMSQAGIPLLIFVVCVYYGMRLMLLQDIKSIRGKGKPPVKNEKAYAKSAGKLILLFAAFTLIMGVLIFVSFELALAEICIGTVIIGILWKNMNAKYGA